ncbi:MAG: YicC family protein [Bacteroidales bacterium]|nr:YicC family protein [Bacteroidales bacterium]
MLQSMTGYGKEQAEINGKKVTVEIKSLNSKQMDLYLKISPLYKNWENEIRNSLLGRLERGKVDLSIYTENISTASETGINTALVESYYEKLCQISRQLGIPMTGDPWPLLLKMPDVLKNESQETDEVEWKSVRELLDKAVDRLVDFRLQEGRMLTRFFEEKVGKIENLLHEVEPYEAERIARIKGRLTDALEKLGQQDYDKNRFEQELIYYLEKLDITEEKTRLRNHCQYFRQTMQEEGGGKGKKLGFILQEMGREINTLGSKSNQAEMQRLVVSMKDELEQMKEQILNVL